ncbi:Arginine biosynthesis bifunctional protein ArgJ, mitochondrial [Wickerhamiella sorbophila]|uniref:Arginine biosynthesis bifunctional protein ArgJ, mitochondrial n=1 Tax=Wickerhamiella sorbophila TaxID=45607 RepID=A0A2T0FFF2_9ASCO|nr:Arginine biosynthesis bifunctional protein ArgJ, mitochondrial [Wickerhamiella sorbophila]PRT53697.1 Arginine biosynthesis bifunctional protein ArgJ, mitochondrial [Wickerhamiella sorbophila]
MKRLAKIPTSGSYPIGFRAGAKHCGVKKDPSIKDLAAIVSDRPCTGAGVFTSNAFKAAPVQVDQAILKSTKGHGFRAMVVNSGCANAVTGQGGIADAKAMMKVTDEVIGSSSESTFVMSTGVIGQRLPIDKILTGIKSLVPAIGGTHDDWLDCAKGIMTTDTFPKLVSASFEASGQKYNIAGMAKGAGMIHPNMATLLGGLFTDAPVAADALQSALKEAVNKSFNSISVDGDMSTNDTIVALANGAAGGPEITISSPDYPTFVAIMTELATDLAKLVVRDGEGATKFVQISVTGAASDAEAKTVASNISQSMLVKTALYGRDANWGRILCATGYSGVQIDPYKTSVSFIPTDGSKKLDLLVNGEPEAVDEARASEILEMHDLEIAVDLGLGSGSATFWTCDLSHEYVTINGDYRS